MPHAPPPRFPALRREPIGGRVDEMRDQHVVERIVPPVHVADQRRHGVVLPQVGPHAVVEIDPVHLVGGDPLDQHPAQGVVLVVVVVRAVVMDIAPVAPAGPPPPVAASGFPETASEPARFPAAVALRPPRPNLARWRRISQPAHRGRSQPFPGHVPTVRFRAAGGGVGDRVPQGRDRAAPLVRGPGRRARPCR